ncbi:MAG: hypothetical protein AAF901_00045 [Bacteroidota bacterium]
MKESIEEKVVAMQPFSVEVSEEFVARTADFPTRSLQLGFVDLGGDRRPKTNKRYPIVSASDESLADLPVPNTQFKRLKIDLFAFYVDDLPDFWSKRNEGLLKISVNTRDPQNLMGADKDATLATNFSVRDGNYAPSFLYRGVFRNVLFEEFINLQFDLYELDTDADVYFNKVKSVINGVPEMKNLDIIKGIPYLNLATQLFESIVTVFGKNADDHIWGEIPILDLNPIVGGAFLRSGAYILFENINSKDETISVSHLEYLNGKVVLKRGTTRTRMPNHLIFGLGIGAYQNATQ